MDVVAELKKVIAEVGDHSTRALRTLLSEVKRIIAEADVNRSDISDGGGDDEQESDEAGTSSPPRRGRPPKNG